MKTIKRLFAVGAFWLAVKVLRISPRELVGAATSRPAPAEAYERDEEMNLRTERYGEPWPGAHVYRVPRRGHVTQKTGPVRRGERR